MVFPGYQSPPSPPPHLLDLHPVEALLVLFWISAAALLRLVADPPRPMRYLHGGYVTVSGLTFYTWPSESASSTVEPIRHPQASAAPAVGMAPGRTVAELRTMARQQGLTQAGSRPIHKARRADLLTALGL